MAKTKTIPQNVEQKTSERGRLYQILIIAGTFIAIVVLSVVARGPGGEWPGPGVVAIRIALLSFFTVVYFWMLYHTRVSRERENHKPRDEKPRGKK